MSKISTDIQKRVQQCIAEMNDVIKEREEVINGIWVARVAQQHVLMKGKGGTAKSLLARVMRDHIEGARLFEVAFDETTDPSQVFGPPDIKGMVEDGKTRRVPDGMLPEATEAFLDEFFNANGPVLHSLQPALNERVWHNNGMPSELPLRQAIMGTNKLNLDPDQMALWDRVHMRFLVNYVSQRENQIALVTDAIGRMAMNGRGTSTDTGRAKTKVTLEELDKAHAESLELDIPDNVIDMYFDLRAELLEGEAGAEISDRRAVEGLAATLAQAWVRGHEEVKIADLDILSHMWWTTEEQMPIVKQTILKATNPGEAEALDLLDGLDELRKEYTQADEDRKKKVGIQQVANADRLIEDAKKLLAQAQSAGTSETRAREVINKGMAFKAEIGRDVFGLDATAQQNLANV